MPLKNGDERLLRELPKLGSRRTPSGILGFALAGRVGSGGSVGCGSENRVLLRLAHGGGLFFGRADFGVISHVGSKLQHVSNLGGQGGCFYGIGLGRLDGFSRLLFLERR